MTKLIGLTLGQYEIKEKIGQGGMAQVFKAYHPGLDRFVAVKVLSPALADEPGFAERFQREAHSVARLHHPNILQVYDFGVQDGYTYLVMRYVENSVTLGDLIRDGVPVDQLINYIIQVADALSYAHERGVIHRDVKPANILIDGRWALLADFGLAKIKASSSQLTGTGVGVGTPLYMSPEQASGEREIDHRTDIYALGVILYRILTGAVPHEAPTPLAVLLKRSSEPVPDPRERNPRIPDSLDKVILCSLDMKPDKRYSTATHFAEALKKAREDTDYGKIATETIPVIEGTTEIDGRPAMEGATNLAADGRTMPSAGVAAWRRNLALIAGGGVAALVLIGALAFFVISSLIGGGDRRSAQTAARIDTPDSGQAAAVVAETDTPAPPTLTPTPLPPSIPQARAKVDLEVRSGPGEAYDLLGFLPADASAEVVSRDRSRGWWQIRTTLAADGVGWIRAGAEFVEVSGTENLPIALAPPTPTPAPSATATRGADTPTATATTPPEIPTATAAPTEPPPSATPTTSRPPTATQAPSVGAGQFTLLKPASLERPSYGPTEFEWRWSGPLGADQGFEVRVWREGEPPAGVHNAVEDNKNGNIVALGNNTYRLTVDISEAAGVRGRGGEYLWTVLLVRVSPGYEDLGIQAAPGRLRLELGGGGDDGGGPQPPIHD